MKSLFGLVFILLLPLYTWSSISITNGLTHIHDMDGKQYDSGSIVIKNLGKKTRRIVVYTEDLKVSCDGTSDYVKAGSTDRSNARWLELTTTERTIGPGEEYTLQYKITPQGELSGSYWSLVMVEVKNPIDTAKLQYGIRVGSNIRYAVQIITNFKASTASKLTFRNVEIAKEKRNRNVVIDIQNDGDLMITPKIKMEIFDASGSLIFEGSAESRKLYPGQCGVFSIPLSKLSGGNYQGSIVADCGESELFGTTVNILIDD